jgi:hypothetical protein
VHDHAVIAGHDRSEGDLRISRDPAELDRDWLAPAMSERANWAPGRSRSLFERSLQPSLSLGAYVDGRQVGFARVDHPGLGMVRASREPPTGPADDLQLRGDGPRSHEAPPGSGPGGFFVSGEGWLPGGSDPPGVGVAGVGTRDLGKDGDEGDDQEGQQQFHGHIVRPVLD